KKRVDELLLEQHLIESIEEAQGYILAGKVFTKKEVKILTAGEKLSVDTELYIKGLDKKYVSRGGLKLEKAINSFHLDLNNKVILDIGASTGGFTDVSLKNGAKLVYALDVGTNQLAWALRTHEKVVVMEQTNFRHSLLTDFKQGQPDLATIDVSFISLELILPPLYDILKDQGEVVALIKPQFEAEKEDVGEGGIVNNSDVYQSVLVNVLDYAEDLSFALQGLTLSPITGTKGNIEFLAYFIKNGSEKSNSKKLIQKVMKNFE